MADARKRLTDEERLKLALERVAKSKVKEAKMQARLDAAQATLFRLPETRREIVLGAQLLKDALDPASGIQAYVLAALGRMEVSDKGLFAELTPQIQAVLEAARPPLRSQARVRAGKVPSRSTARHQPPKPNDSA